MPFTDDHQGRDHQDGGDGRVAGIRAPLQLRKNSNLCIPEVTDGPFSTQYLSLEDDTPTDPDYLQIRQIGWDADPLAAPMAQPNCKFWAIGRGSPHDYDCSEPDDTITYFAVQAFSGSPNFIEDLDCGQIDWSHGCEVEGSDGTPGQYEADASDENEPACVVVTAGSSGDSVNYGTPDHAIHIKNDIGDPWNVISLEQNYNTGCPSPPDYHHSWNSTQNTMQSWDDRNTS